MCNTKLHKGFTELHEELPDVSVPSFPTGPFTKYRSRREENELHFGVRYSIFSVRYLPFPLFPSTFVNRYSLFAIRIPAFPMPSA